jgi:3-oxosteroid 1-dehydrogenase
MIFGRKKTNWDREVDLLIAGSGGAGLTAALTAAGAGLSVELVEKSSQIGGTTAVSGGVIWVPNNHQMADLGIEDSRTDALNYLTRIADGRSSNTLLSTYVDAAPAMTKAIEALSSIKFSALAKYPDYHPEFEGGRRGGRSMETGLFDTNTLGEWAPRLRRSAIFGATPMSVAEALEWGVFSNPLNLPYRDLAKRFSEGLVCYGASLVGGLLRGCLDRGVVPRVSAAVDELIIENRAVTGALINGERVGARQGVLLACGGFEWNTDLCQQYLGGILTHPNSPPVNHGDGLHMAMSAGADLANMNEAWWCPSVVVPGEEYDGIQLNRGEFAIRSLPHSIIVNQAGRRFVNEAHNYNDMMKPFFNFDPVSYTRPNLPAYLVVDQQYADKYLLVTSVPGMPIPTFMQSAQTLRALADKIGVDAEGLLQTVSRFNTFADQGVDEDFQRGWSFYDHCYGDPNNQPNPNLGRIEKGPFHAIQIHPGALGTKGGARVDEHARVLNTKGRPIQGLYAAGNAAAAVTGAGYPGAGATIGAAMTWGWLAGSHAARRGN